MKQIYQKLFRLQQEFKSKKDQINKFGNFKYRNFEQMMDDIKPMLKDLNLILVTKEQLVCGTDYMECIVTLIDLESGEDFATSSISKIDPAYKGMSCAQASGATISYLRKYAAAALLAIGAGEDPDSLPMNREETPKKKPTKAETISNIIEQVNAAVTYDELTELWNQIGRWKEDAQIKTAFTARKEAIRQNINNN